MHCRHDWCLFLSIIAVLIFSTPAQAENRIALVVGNSSYRNVARLNNPTNDAKLIADTLQAIGFKLTGGGALLDLDRAALENAVQEFGAQAQGADVALFYYAGHGLQVSGSNYLVPVSANPIREADADFQMLNVGLVLRQMEASGSRLKLMILDACRNNPFVSRGFRSVERGLARVEVPDGTLISYATQPGQIARDGSDGNSPYTKVLTQMMLRPGLDLFQTFNNVGLAVKSATGGEQQPWVSFSPIAGSFYFAGPPSAGPPGLAIESQEPARTTPPTAPPVSPPSSRLQAGDLFSGSDMERVKAIAEKHGFVLPGFTFQRPGKDVPAPLRRFVGVWASEVASGGGRGRQIMLIVTNVDARGSARGYWVAGFNPGRQEPPVTQPLAGKIANEQFMFSVGRFPGRGISPTARFGPDNLLYLYWTRDGMPSSITTKPVWLLVEAERVANR